MNIDKKEQNYGTVMVSHIISILSKGDVNDE